MKVLTVLLALWPLLVSAQGWNSRPLSTIALHPEFRAPAAVHPREEASLAAEVAARVVALPVRAGEAAGRGAELARLDDAAYRIERERSRAASSAGEGAAMGTLLVTSHRILAVTLPETKSPASCGARGVQGLRTLSRIASERVACSTRP